jgi:hypothetical protein
MELQLHMKLGSIATFAKIREEIQFWPAAVFAFRLTVDATALIWVSLVLSVWTGACFYKVHEAIRKWGAEQTGWRDTFERNSRGGLSNQSAKDHISDAGDFTEVVLPENSIKMLILVVSLLTNVVLGVIGLVWLILWFVNSTSPSLTSLTLLMLPVTVIAVTASSLLWAD